MKEGKSDEALKTLENCINACIECIKDLQETTQVRNESKDDESDETIKTRLLTCIEKADKEKQWDDIVGQEKAKESLKETVILPFKFPEFFKKRKIENRTVLLYGPSGTGKTELAKTAASLSGAVFFNVRSSMIKSMWSGRSGKNIRVLFDLAKTFEKTIIFLDEFESLCTQRSNDRSDDTVTELLQAMNDLKESNIIVIACTNIPYLLDSAVVQRFSEQILVDLPTCEERKVLILNYFVGLKIPNNLKEEDYQKFATLTEG